MKTRKSIKAILITANLFFLPFMVWGQAIRVDNGGIVNFGSSIKIRGSFSEGTGIHIDGRPGVISTSIRYGLYSRIDQAGIAPTGDLVAVCGESLTSLSGGNSVRHIGVWGRASSNSNAILSAGILGGAGTHGRSAGIYGRIGTSLPSSTPFAGLYAGYFDGAVNVQGTLSINGVTVQASDENLKRNIELISDNAIEKLFSLRPVKYNIRQIERDADSLTSDGEKISFKEKFFNEESEMFKKLHYGFSAQELQKVFPDLVYDGQEGFLSVNYIGLIPIMLQAIQQQQQAIQRQQQEIDELRSQNLYNYGTFFINETDEKKSSKSVDPTLPQSQLFQNIPNPFNRTTTIDYRLAENATNAKICIYNLTGRQLLCFDLPATRGEGSVEVHASSLQSGMYIYALIVDGKIIDTKRMVLTE